MSQISFPRKGYGGINITRNYLEKKYYERIEAHIKGNLQRVHDGCTNIREKYATRYFMIYLQKIILAQPTDLLSIRERVLNHYGDLFNDRSNGSFNKRILDAFGYAYYRNSILVTLAKWLDIRTCPYCNSHYTLFLDAHGLRNHLKGLAIFQFDHFINKGEAPFLSMSLYNLIPSCAVCNLLKRSTDLPIELNPYASNINSLYRFQVFKPLRLWTGNKLKKGTIKILLKPTHPAYKDKVEILDGTMLLSKRYGRCQDVAQDVFERAYTYPYYNNVSNFRNMLSLFDKEEFKRIWMGTYTDMKDIEKRPFTKFTQDLWEQARSLL